MPDTGGWYCMRVDITAQSAKIKVQRETEIKDDRGMGVNTQEGNTPDNLATLRRGRREAIEM